MTKVELHDFLKKVDKQFWGKLKEFINDKDFIEAWYEELKDYEISHIEAIFEDYDNMEFPPSAKYFSVNAKKQIKWIEHELKYMENAIRLASDSEESKHEFRKYMESIPMIDKLQLAEDISREYTDYVRNKGFVDFRGWLNERGK